MAEARKVVGWFYRNGKRIPIFEKKSSEQGAIKAAGDHLNHHLGAGESYARVDSVGLSGNVSYSKDVIVPTGRDNETGRDLYETETEYGTAKMPLRAGKGKRQLRENVRARDRKSRNEILDYDHDAAKAFEGVFDVASPRATANLTGKRVRTGDGKIVRPVKRTGIDMETRVNDSIGRSPEAYGIIPESKVDDAVAESVGKELSASAKAGRTELTAKDLPNLSKPLVKNLADLDRTSGRQARLMEERAKRGSAESVGKELSASAKAGRGGKRKPKKDPNALDRNVPNYLKDGVSETAFTDTRGERQWAKNVASLPEKKRRFSNGYSKLGSTEERDIYADRDSTNGTYYATPKKPGGTGGVGGRSPRPGIRYSGKTRGEAALKKNVKTAMGRTGRRRDGIHLPQERALADKKPGESYIKYIMEERGLSRADAIKFIMDKRKGI